ncbi:SRPBCC family protein [Microbacteriaceae bacterium K1510]|nr:SRPBCC family protein [Microbacteriaceae bacterium K1510]
MNVNLDGEFDTAASVDETFAFITTPERFAPVLPYFKVLQVKDSRHFTVTLEVGVPQIRGRADVDAEIVESTAPSYVAYSIKGRHTLGMMDSRMTFTLTPAEGGSHVAWAAQSVVSGTLASLAQGILLPLAKRQVKSLVQAVRSELAGEKEQPTPSLLSRGTSSLRGLFSKTAGTSR